MQHNDSSNELTELKTASKDFVWFSLTPDKSIDNEDIAQLLIFIHGINDNFITTEKKLMYIKRISYRNNVFNWILEIKPDKNKYDKINVKSICTQM